MGWGRHFLFPFLRYSRKQTDGWIALEARPQGSEQSQRICRKSSGKATEFPTLLITYVGQKITSGKAMNVLAKDVNFMSGTLI